MQAPKKKYYRKPHVPKHQLTFLQRWVQGAIGKKYVVKHYKGGRIVKTAYPNMKNIVPSSKQKISRRTFRKAVQFAQRIYWNPQKKVEWKKKLRKPWRLFQALMKVYYRRKRDKADQGLMRRNHWRRNVLLNGGLPKELLHLSTTNETLATPAVLQGKPYYTLWPKQLANTLSPSLN